MENIKPEMEFIKLNPLPRYIRRRNLRDLIKKGHDPYTTGLYTGQLTGYKQGYAEGLLAAQKIIMERAGLDIKQPEIVVPGADSDSVV